MYVGNIAQWQRETAYLPTKLTPWIEKLASLDVQQLTPGRHELGDGNYMNVDVTETAPAAQRNMEAHRAYIDIQMVIEGSEIIGYQPVCRAGDVVEDRSASDAWFYQPPVTADMQIHMEPGTFTVFTPADGHRCLCAPDGVGRPIRKIIMKIKI